MNSGTEILKILKEQNIKSIKDIDNYGEFKDIFYGEEFTWINDIFNIIRKDIELSNEQLLKNEKKYITFSNDSDDILKYSCMFPETSINLKEDFEEHVTTKGKTFFYMPKDFFRSLLIHKKLIQDGVYKVLPEIKRMLVPYKVSFDSVVCCICGL